jgi:hypothetical protein
MKAVKPRILPEGPEIAEHHMNIPFARTFSIFTILLQKSEDLRVNSLMVTLAEFCSDMEELTLFPFSLKIF